jgi:hypothetical protein
MPENVKHREWLETEELQSSAPGLPRPDLNPLVNPLLGQNMGRWAQVYFTSPPDQREQAVEKLLQELQAEGGTKKPTGSESTRTGEKTVLPEIPQSRPETEFPALPIQGSANDELAMSDEEAQNFVMCPGCLHKNPAEQRFCGICGIVLGRDVAASAGNAPLPPQRTRHTEDPESDWRWLRERSLSGYEVQSESGSRSRVLIVLLALLVVGLGGYLLWQNRARLSHEAPAAPPSSVSEPTSAPSIDLPIAATPSLVPGKHAPKARLQANPSSVAAKPTVQDEVKIRTSDSSRALSDDGRDEFDRARQYLAGEGVPKNSWMASQLLWKAIGKQNGEAVLLLSDLYARGDGVPRSCEQARILLVSAARKGSSAAAQKLRSIETSCR